MAARVSRRIDGVRCSDPPGFDFGPPPAFITRFVDAVDTPSAAFLFWR